MQRIFCEQSQEREFTYGDLNAIVGEDQGRVGNSELGVRHGGRGRTGDEVSRGAGGEREVEDELEVRS